MPSELKATRGPWRIKQGPWKISILSPEKNPSDLVAEVSVYTQSGDLDNQKANAHLLAASWELYQALEALVEPTYLEHLSVMVNRGKAALAKARGEQ